MENQRKTEVVNQCLDLFIEKGLYNTSTRDLSKALNLQSGGLYYYFKTKDEAVVSCVEAAIFRLEDTLIQPVKKEVFDPANMMASLMLRAKEMAPVMRFVVTACSDRQYEALIKPILDRLGDRYAHYCEVFAQILNCKLQEITPYVYMCITAITNYMIFGEESFVSSQLKAVQLKLERMIQNTQVNYTER